ncbi:MULTISPECIES: KUP/HAK/KT family potassium transporter [unclassified Enterococcus]|uniref:KUP/HAK/KT family potassium transporter n=1 Tax=unclassified Enterococcus TaxID=2608891 RepID=UPI001557A32D|nr:MULTISPECIES: KUP/HAK/KT family potassium transporter [unclassified Enterococcus]MBS7577347.1 KUP/HAK/KT family potassium transporter [Enterococcus sp. MMGLQ5-2]MBS7584754.1 KUP/HAK/KT family potassium transporter [Enterococcus sp. MMGLQ5-1]NPD12609.1 potassium transporter Kup [Enterococcus sp. MMGLQ5-1]NPD37181.1 potassium transporter Kup [Enterococcus sp. MMGLQ5-2]
MSKETLQSKATLGGMLVATGIVYGDIGTSPLYVMKSILEGQGGINHISEAFLIGAVSLVLWTMTLLTTFKYVLIALKADNHGEGGIFSLFTLVRKNAKWLIIPAMIGGSALLADGVLTPAMTVTTAMEGLKDIPAFTSVFGTSQDVIIVLTLMIITVLFVIQRFGTEKIGKAFGPIMLGWFTFIGVIGFSNMLSDLSVLRAINPYYAIELLFSPENKAGLMILGSVFLATTGAEALYSDLGHVGKYNIYMSWPYIKITLLLSYFGQAAFLLRAKELPQYQEINSFNPFFNMIPDALMLFGVIFASVAAIIASQALITGAFTLVSEAMKLRLLPRLKIMYPGNSRGQMYLPMVNGLLWILTIGIVIGFRTSHKMESAYGLAITVTMLMTTILLYYFLIMRGWSKLISIMTILFFLSIETIFFISSLAKFFHGGYVAVLIAVVILAIMSIWEKGNLIQENMLNTVNLRDYLGQINSLSNDPSFDLYQTNLVYLTTHMQGDEVEEGIVYSILDKQPKKAVVYWFVNIEVTDEPYTKAYTIDTMNTDYIVKVKLFLGFRVKQDIKICLSSVVKTLIADGRLKAQHQKYSIKPGREIGDFRYILIQEELANHQNISKFNRQIMQAKLFIKRFATTPDKWFGLEYSDTTYETIPLFISDEPSINLSLTEIKK